MSSTLMISAAVSSSFRVLRIRDRGMLFGVVAVAAHQRHHRHAGLEARQPQRQLREQQQRDSRDHRPGCRAGRTGCAASR